MKLFWFVVWGFFDFGICFVVFLLVKRRKNSIYNKRKFGFFILWRSWCEGKNEVEEDWGEWKKEGNIRGVRKGEKYEGVRGEEGSGEGVREMEGRKR